MCRRTDCGELATDDVVQPCAGLAPRAVGPEPGRSPATKRSEDLVDLVHLAALDPHGGVVLAHRFGVGGLQ